MTKGQANRKLYQVYKMLNSITMQFRLNRKMVDYGITCVYDNDPTMGAKMYVDPQKREFIGTVLHECRPL